MFGIPFTIRRENSASLGNKPGTEERVVYLRSRRCGDLGEKMRKLFRQYHASTFAQMRAATRAGSGTTRAMSSQDDPIALEKILAEQESAMDAAQKAAQEQLDAAEQIAVMALSDNYPKEQVSDIVDGLTDHELHGIVSTLELGSMPKDFFPSPAIQPKQSDTSQSGEPPAKRS